MTEVAPLLMTMTEALLGQSLMNVDNELSKLLICMFDFEMRPARMML